MKTLLLCFGLLAACHDGASIALVNHDDMRAPGSSCFKKTTVYTLDADMGASDCYQACAELEPEWGDTQCSKDSGQLDGTCSLVEADGGDAVSVSCTTSVRGT
ncbi:MAG: hypothetical protein ABI321_23710 [Polyangia bacterium]